VSRAGIAASAAPDSAAAAMVREMSAGEREWPRGIVNHHDLRGIVDDTEGIRHRVLARALRPQPPDRLRVRPADKAAATRQVPPASHDKLVDQGMRQEQADAALQGRLAVDAATNCFGTAAPKRCPRPPAAMMAETNMAGTTDYRLSADRAPGGLCDWSQATGSRPLRAATAATTMSWT
jgi:hypothetical protein